MIMEPTAAGSGCGAGRPRWLPREVWPFELRSVRISGARVAYTDVGSGPALVLCHAGMWSFLWRDVMTRLAAGYRCVTFDPPGSGLSQPVAAERRNLGLVRDSIVGLVETLDLERVTLVMHDLGGPPALAAAAALPRRVVALAAVATFGWRPSGALFRSMLALFGAAWMRELDAATGWLPLATTTRLGAGRHLDQRSREVFRRGMDRDARRTMHHLFRSARRSDEVYEAATRATDQLAHRPVLTVFGAFGDYLRLRRGWRARFADVTEVTVPRGLHFPMCDAPGLTATSIDAWHRRRVR